MTQYTTFITSNDTYYSHGIQNNTLHNNASFILIIYEVSELFILDFRIHAWEL